MSNIRNTLYFLLLGAVSISSAEPRVWTSTSGSTIEATYLGNFSDNLWFEGTDPQRSLLKMPAKYISKDDLFLIETDEITPQITPQAIDSEDDNSIALLEQLFKTKVPAALESTLTLEDALNRLISHIQQSEDTEIRVKLHRKVDEDATRTEPINGPTVYACLQTLTETHELTWSIRKGVLTLRLK